LFSQNEPFGGYRTGQLLLFRQTGCQPVFVDIPEQGDAFVEISRIGAISDVISSRKFDDLKNSRPVKVHCRHEVVALNYALPLTGVK
jgi:hypothetical protein